MDPRIRISAALILSVEAALLNRFPPMFLALALAAALVVAARLKATAVLRRIAIVNVIVLLFWMVVPFTFKGETLFMLGPLAATREGVLYACSVTLKSNAIILAFIALAGSMSVATAGHALDRLGFPRKIITLLLLTYRYVFVIEQEYRRLMRAIKARGFRPGTGMHTYRTYAYLVGMLFVRSWDRAERVHQAMKCRGFKGRFYSLREFRTSPADAIFSALMAAGIFAMVMMEWMNVNR